MGLTALSSEKLQGLVISGVKFVGEAGIDAGGPRREWMALMLEEALSSERRGLFVGVGGGDAEAAALARTAAIAPGADPVAAEARWGACFSL